MPMGVILPGGTAGQQLAQVGRPVQERIPIWVVAAWPRPKSMRRVLRCDGVIPHYDLGGRDPAAQDARDMRSWLAAHGARTDLDVVAGRRDSGG